LLPGKELISSPGSTVFMYIFKSNIVINSLQFKYGYIRVHDFVIFFSFVFMGKKL